MPPPNHHTGVRPAGVGGEHAHVHVHRRHVRVARMEDERDAHRLERRAGQLGPRAAWPTAAARARHVREVARRRARAARRPRQREAVALPPPSRPLPGVATEACRRRSLERGDDALLQAEQVRRGRRRVHATRHSAAAPARAMARWPMSRAVLRAVELDRAPRPRRRAAAPPCTDVAERGDAQHAAAARDDVAVRELGAGMEHHADPRPRRGQPGDRVALARRVRVAGGGHHHAERDAPVPLQLRPGRACRRARADQQVEQVALQPHHDRLRLRVAQPAVEFEHRLGVAVRRRSSGRHRGSRCTACLPSPCRDRRLDDLAHHARVHVGVTTGAGEYAPMPPVFGPWSPSRRRL